MDRRAEQEQTSYRYDTTIVVEPPLTSKPMQAREFAQIFEKLTPDKQIRNAYYCVDQLKIRPDYLALWITNEVAKDQFRLWCIGKGIEIPEDRRDDTAGTRRTTGAFLADDQELIDRLAPLLTQRDLAEIRTLRHYQNAAEEELQYLVGGSYRLIGEYLGNRRSYRRIHDKPPFLPLPDLPIELFESDLIAGILWESQRINSLEAYNQSSQACFDQLEMMRRVATHPTQVAFVQKLVDYFHEVDAQEFPMFNNLIAGSLKDLPEAEITYSRFPSNHQKEYAYNLAHKELGPYDLLVGGTGTQKTGGVITGLAKVGAEATFVVCPPGLPREDWVKEIREKYKEPVDVFRLLGLGDLRTYLNQEETGRPQFIVAGYTLLSSIDRAADRDQLIQDLVHKTGRDSLVFDESHLSKELSAQCTKVLFDISKEMPASAPRIAMTATAIVNSVDDLDAPVRILMPFRYPQPGDFTREARNEPHLVSALLHGKKLLTRWPKETILRGQLPEVEYVDTPVPFSPFQQVIYEHVYLDNLPEGRVKREMLRQASLDPLLIKKYYSPTGIGREIVRLQQRLADKQDDHDRRILESIIEGLRERARAISSMYDVTTAQTDLVEAHGQYQRWVLSENPNEIFDEDFLVKLGFDRLALWAFFNLPDSVNSLVRSLDNGLINQDWEGKHGVYSSKYRRLKEKLDGYAAEGKTKVLIFSGFYKTGVTTVLEDSDDIDEDSFLSLYENLIDWYGARRVGKIDGSVTAEPKRNEDSDREKVRKAFRLDPNLQFLLLTIRSSRLGINLTVPPTQANSHLEKVAQIYLDDPDTYADKAQGIGRSDRPGQLIPIEVDTFRATHSAYPTTLRYGFIDQGLTEALEFKRLVSQMVLDSIPLTPDEERFIRDRLVGTHVQQLYPETPRAYLINVFYPTVRGGGYRRNREFLKDLGFEGGSNADFYATNYPLVEELGLAGHNARVITEVIRKYKELSGRENLKIGSAGAGTGVLQAMLGDPIVNIDMMEEMLQVGRQRFSDQGSFVAGDIAHLPIRSETFDVIDASLGVHWTDYRAAVRQDWRLISERALALEELLRTVKMNGLVTVSVPYTHLTNELYTRWLQVFEHLGARQMPGLPNGLIKATDFREESISWVFNLEKVSQPTAGIDSNLLEFDFDRIFDNIGPNRRKGHDRVIGINLPLPHHEFEVVNPGGDTDTITFVDTSIGDELKRALAREDREFKTATDVLARLGSEEYGMQRRLTKEARSKWKLDVEQAEELSLKAIEVWIREGRERYNIRSMWSELQEIMTELREGEN